MNCNLNVLIEIDMQHTQRAIFCNTFSHFMGVDFNQLSFAVTQTNRN